MRSPLPVPDATLQALVPFAEEYVRAHGHLKQAVAVVVGMFPGLDPATVHYNPVTRAFYHEFLGPEEGGAG